MRIGLIARADNRGLGIQTWEAYRHLQPTKTLVVDMGDLTPYEQHFDWYPDARRSSWRDGRLEPAAMTWLLQGVDVVFTCETPYDFTLYDRARAYGVKTVCQVNPEFWLYDRHPDLQRPDRIVAPTTWRLSEMRDVIHLAHPVARDRLPFRLRSEARTFLHVAGHPAAADRAGTKLLMQALAYVRAPVKIIVKTQHRLRHEPPRLRLAARVEVHVADHPNYWEPYESADVLIAPRRYGGQSLPANEALSSGMPVIAIDREPERSWGGVVTVPGYRTRDLRAQCGTIECLGCDPQDLARMIDHLAEDPDAVQQLSRDADAHAETISWDTMLPRYMALFESLC